MPQAGHYGKPLAEYQGLRVIQCLACGYAHQDPLPEQAELDAYYAKDRFYTQHSPSDWFSKNKAEHLAGFWWPAYDDQIKNLAIRLPYYPLARTRGYPQLVDVGCGDGWFLHRYSQHVPRGNAWGIEPSATARLLAPNSHWIKPSIPDLLDEWQISAIELKPHASARMALVLEHVIDPVLLTMTISKNFVGKHGKLLITVPNEFNPLQNLVRKRYGQAWFIQAPHVNYFTRQSARSLLEACGYRVTYETGTFPIELAWLLGWRYLGNDAIGRQVHHWRLQFEKRNPQLAFRLYHLLYKTLSWGREIVLVGQKL